MSTKTSVPHQLERLQARCRRLELACLALVLLTLGSCLIAAVSPDERVVRARSFEVVDASGRVCAALEASEAGEPALEMLGPAGERHIVLGVGLLASDCALSLSSPGASTIIGTVEGRAALLMEVDATDPAGFSQIRIGAGDDQAVVAAVGGDLTEASVSADGTGARFELNRIKETATRLETVPGALMHLTDDAAELVLYDRDGGEIARQP